MSADYVLEYRNTKLGVVEAKAWDKLLTEGVGQAKEYASKLAIRFADLGKADEIGQVFAGFQRYLYQQQGVA